MSTITIGADPEVFITNNGKFISAHNIVLGTKEHPASCAGGATQVDGVAAEFNVDPSESLEEFKENLLCVMDHLTNTIRMELPKANLLASPTAIFDEDYFNSLPQEATLLGCSPDYNAWKNGEENDPPSTDEPFRTGAGHVHIGFTEFENPHDEDHFSKCIELTKMLDLTLFIKSLSWDDDVKRRSLYGNPGSFRPKHFGVEYRPPSNKWLTREETIDDVYNTTHKVTQMFLDGDSKKVLSDDILVSTLERCDWATNPNKRMIDSAIDHMKMFGI